MKPTSDWADAHSHLADPRIQDPDALILEAQRRGIGTFLQGGVGPEDWARQRELAARHPGVLPVFGLHPYWISDHPEEECEAALDRLARELPGAAALGETGLDFRPKIMKDSRERQLAFFQAQLELARFAGKPVVLHLVRAFEESLQFLDLYGEGVRGLVHAFTGSAVQARAYVDRGFLVSIGGPVCRPDLIRLHQAVRSVPIESILLETDSPDQPPPGIEPGANRPATVLQVAAEIARLKGMDRDQVLDKTRENLGKLLAR